MTKSASPPPLYERIEAAGRLLALIVRAENNPDQTVFLTEQTLPFQAGFVVYPKGGEVVAHEHKPLRRDLTTTSEALIVRSGSCVLDIYNPERRHVATRHLFQGDLVLLYAGGHRVLMPSEKCVLLEIKQGPYTGIDEKERFVP